MLKGDGTTRRSEYIQLLGAQNNIQAGIRDEAHEEVRVQAIAKNVRQHAS